MNIRTYDLKEIRDFLIEERWDGMAFVAYPSEGITEKNELRTFFDRNEAIEFCAMMLPYDCPFDYLSTRSVYRAIDAATEHGYLNADNHGIINIRNVVEEYHKRLEEQKLETIKEKEGKMNQENFEYLGKQMLYAGLGEVPLNELKTKLIEGNEEFQLNLTKKFGTDNVMAKLNFKRSNENTDMYFFNSYDVLIKKEGQAETMQQNFRISYGNDFRFDEAYKLMSGRAVHKTFVMTDRIDKNIKQEYPSWNYMDFKDVNEYGNYKIVKDSSYDIEKKLDEYPIKGLEDEATKAKIVGDLKRGEGVTVTLATSKDERKVIITANPKFNTLDLYNENMEKINLSSNKTENQEAALNQEQNQQQDQTLEHQQDNKEQQEQKLGHKQDNKNKNKIEKPAPAENQRKGKRVG